MYKNLYKLSNLILKSHGAAGPALQLLQCFHFTFVEDNAISKTIVLKFQLNF